VGAVSNRSSTHEGVRRIAIENLGSGSVIIEPLPRADLVECSIDANDEHFLENVQVRPEQDGLRLIFPPEPDRGAATRLRLGVPDDLEYAITVGSADVTVRAIIGRSKITSGSGHVGVGHATDLECSTGSGNISVESVSGQAARLVSGSGDITVNEAQCPVSARSGSGRVTVKCVHHHHVQANSGSGDIAVNKTSGTVDLRTASGSLTVGVADGLPAWLDLDSGAGEIRIGLDSTHQPPPHESYVSVRARTASGDITVHRA
jgi:putative adhesin